MNRESNRTFYGQLFLGAALLFCAFVALRSCGLRHQTPSIGGQNVPQKTFQIDFNRRYNVICSGYQARKDAVTYENVSILGFVGSADPSRNTRGLSSYSYGYFNYWLVLELEDKRKVYLPSSSISIIEEVKSN